MKKGIILAAGLILYFGLSVFCYGAQTIEAKKVDKSPVIDGSGSDSLWTRANEYTVYDEVANISMTLKAVYTDTGIFFLASYPDPNESITQKTWVWNKDMKTYKTGSDREDMFVFKWNMEAGPVDLSLKSDNDYMADIWFWKACRTDPVGYADDKYQRYSSIEVPKAMQLTSKTGRTFYLLRKGDSGTSAYQNTLYGVYKGDKMSKYTNVLPAGSRADVKAKGIWSGGRWTIEFARALKTGNTDDIQFNTSKSYLFGVSRYEIAGRKPNPKVDQPLYGSGDVSEKLTLIFGK